ncbi:TonB-dependent receptor [Winogradskyella maritima]|nr:TonB-dependent receptor [Winogradskyella maritima]
MFRRKSVGTLDYFNKVTNDVILFATTPDPINPTEKYWTNFPDMKVKNKGYEVALDYRGNAGEDFTL